MDFKELLKPTKGNIILFIILFLIFPVPFWVTELGGPEDCSGMQTCDLGGHYEWFALGGVFLIFSLVYGGNQMFYVSEYWWKIPYMIIVPYLLSCALIFAYAKLKVKK